LLNRVQIGGLEASTTVRALWAMDP
jgi:hypothetical protein